MPKDKKALGKGLEALLGENSLLGTGEIEQLDVEKIVENPNQPRRKILNIEELANSIKEKGVIQPIIVTKSNDKYEIIAGERRWRATKLAGLKTIPAIVRKIEDNEKLELALIENIQREDLDPVDEANAFKILIEKFNLSQEELAKRVGKQRSTIANSLRLLNLPNKILDDLKDGRLQPGHVRPLINIKNPNLLFHLRDKIVNENLSVRQAEELVKKYKPELKHKQKKKPKRIQSPALLQFEERLQQSLGTKVKIEGDINSGKIIIDYYIPDDLERIVEIILKE